MSIVVSLSTVSTTVYFYTVVQDQCTIVALYYCITSLPVYPNTVHGHCTTVVLDTTSNSVYCIATLMESTVQCIARGMEVLYMRITNVQQFATEAGAPHVISNAAAIHLVLTALERTGMFTDACADWLAQTSPCYTNVGHVQDRHESRLEGAESPRVSRIRRISRCIIRQRPGLVSW